MKAGEESGREKSEEEESGKRRKKARGKIVVMTCDAHGDLHHAHRVGCIQDVPPHETTNPAPGFRYISHTCHA